MHLALFGAADASARAVSSAYPGPPPFLSAVKGVTRIVESVHWSVEMNTPNDDPMWRCAQVSEEEFDMVVDVTNCPTQRRSNVQR